MDQTQPMAPGRFLELLNKSDRTMQEENDLQAELKRQEAEKSAENAQPAVSETVAPESVPTESEVETQPLVDQTSSEAQATPAPEVTEEPKDDKPYDLTQLSDELGEAIEYMDTQSPTLATEMAKSALTQAAYWTKLASEGK